MNCSLFVSLCVCVCAAAAVSMTSADVNDPAGPVSACVPLVSIDCISYSGHILAAPGCVDI